MKIANNAKSIQHDSSVIKYYVEATEELIRQNKGSNRTICYMYDYLGDYEKAYTYTAQFKGGEIDVNAASSFLQEIRVLFLLNRKQEAVELARKFDEGVADKYKITPQAKEIQNIAANHCGFSTLPAPKKMKRK